MLRKTNGYRPKSEKPQPARSLWYARDRSFRRYFVVETP